MKNLILIATLLLANRIAYTQNSTPEAVKNAFENKFPKAENAKFILEKNGNYEVEYTLNGKSNSANFSKKGICLESEEQISYNETPIKVQDFIAINYVRFVVTKTEKVSKSNKIVYEITLNKGKIAYELSLDAAGKLLNKKKK